MPRVDSQNESTGHDWRAKQLRKKSRTSHTPGKQKGERCIASPLARWFCRRNRSYKHIGYNDWERKTRENSR